MEGIIRKDDTPQHKAVREALTNAIIHADFMLNGILKVEKYDDRFVLTNPGLLKLPIEQIYSGGESKARNQRMQSMLRMIGYGENLGSGFPIILNAWNEKHWLKPELVEQPELMQVKLILHIETKNVAKDVAKEISDRQHIILGFLQDSPTLSATELSQKTGMTTRTIQRDLADLQEKGILSREGSRKGGRWVILKEIK
jgi:predicted HTH transcriptional regulator